MYLSLNHRPYCNYTGKKLILIMSSNKNIFRVIGPLCGEFTGHRWIPLRKASDAELWCFLWSAPEQSIEQTIKTPVIWNAIALIMTSLSCDILHGVYIIHVLTYIQVKVPVVPRLYTILHNRYLHTPRQCFSRTMVLNFWREEVTFYDFLRSRKKIPCILGS